MTYEILNNYPITISTVIVKRKVFFLMWEVLIKNSKLLVILIFFLEYQQSISFQ